MQGGAGFLEETGSRYDFRISGIGSMMYGIDLMVYGVDFNTHHQLQRLHRRRVRSRQLFRGASGGHLAQVLAWCVASIGAPEVGATVFCLVGHLSRGPQQSLLPLPPLSGNVAHT